LSTKTTATTGSMASTPAAATSELSLWKVVLTSEESLTITGTALLVERIKPNRNSFHAPIKAKIAVATTPGAETGMITRNSAPSREQPSMRAAASSA
jgi:hypothetical protein